LCTLAWTRASTRAFALSHSGCPTGPTFAPAGQDACLCKFSAATREGEPLLALPSATAHGLARHPRTIIQSKQGALMIFFEVRGAARIRVCTLSFKVRCVWRVQACMCECTISCEERFMACTGSSVCARSCTLWHFWVL